jgi:superfamily I DNA/RNA helicase
LETGDGHILLEARAGTGKSTSCREGMWRLLDVNRRLAIRYCCFNKKIAEEFRVKCPPGVEVGTMHRFGLMSLGDAFGSKVDAHKTYTVIDGMEGGPDLKRYVRKSIAVLVGLAKNHGLRPDDPTLRAQLDEFIWLYDVETWRRQPEIVRWAIEVLAKSAEMTTLVDFDDMLWLTVLHGTRFPNVDLLFIDECQDLNPVQHMMAERLTGSGRTIIVGDPFQSIYAFRGADSDSIPKLRDRLDAKVMPLTVTFRCPRSHVEVARQLVPDFEAAPGAEDGLLVRSGKDAIDLARPGDMVLCRANAPIVSACLRSIADRVPAIVRGRAIGDSLLAVVKKVGDTATVKDFLVDLHRWEAKEIDRLDAKDGSENQIEAVRDKAMCLEAISESCSSPAEIPAVISQLFSDDDAETRITFSSVHRAKGSESRRVFYLQIPYSEKRDAYRPPQPWEVQQRKNLRYVALTRSLSGLYLVDPNITPAV